MESLVVAGQSKAYGDGTKIRPTSFDNTEGSSGEVFEVSVAPSKQRLNFLGIVSLAFVICNSWAGVSGSLQLALLQGGSATLIYSILLTTVAYLSTSSSLAELASVYPTAGGQYHFASILAPQKFNRGISYVCGFLSIMSWVAIGASITIIPAQQIFAIVSVLDDTFVTKTWHVFLVYEFLALFVLLFNIFGLKYCTWSHKIGFFLTLSLFLSMTISLLVRSEKASSKSVWATFTNATGWPDGVCFLTGLTTSCYMYIGVDASMHLAEECDQPRKTVPRAMVGAIMIGFLTALPFTIVALYSLSDIDSILTSTAYIPFAVIQQGFRSTNMAIVFTLISMVMTFFILFAVQETSSRLAWAFARDKGLIYSNLFEKIHPRLEVPVYSLVLTWALLAISGCVFMASTTAFNALIGSSIVLQQLSFAIPIALLVYRKRPTEFLPRNRQFRMPEPLAWFANVFSLMFTVIVLVFFNFPSFLPVTASTMNYTSVILAITLLLGVINWFIHGAKHFAGPRIEVEDE